MSNWQSWPEMTTLTDGRRTRDARMMHAWCTQWASTILGQLLCMATTSFVSRFRSLKSLKAGKNIFGWCVLQLSQGTYCVSFTSIILTFSVLFCCTLIYTFCLKCLFLWDNKGTILVEAWKLVVLNQAWGKFLVKLQCTLSFTVRSRRRNCRQTVPFLLIVSWKQTWLTGFAYHQLFRTFDLV